MALFALFRLTDGTTTVDLMRGAFKLHSWSPRITQLKGGGAWLDSPLADGRRLISGNYANVQEVINLDVLAGGEDIIIREVQDLRRLLTKLLNYGRSDWQDEPVWLEVRGLRETNTRYGILRGWSTPEDQDPFSHEFILRLAENVVMPNWALTLERDPFWLEYAPGESTCVEVSGKAIILSDSDIFYPTQSADDCHVTNGGGGAIILAGGTINFGNAGGGTGTLDNGTRFRSVNIPANAVITSAFIRFQSSNNTPANLVNTRIIGQDSATPAVFSTYANFQGRARTTAITPWNKLHAWVTDVYYDTPDITPIIQEIIDLPTWPAGGNLVVFIEDNGSESGGIRYPAGWDNLTRDEPALHLSWKVEAGRTETCNNEVFVGNKHNEAELSHIFVDDGGVFGANLLDGAIPHDLMPAAPLVGDAVYFGIDTGAADSGPFCSLIFDLATGMAPTGTHTGIWEYIDGTGPITWAALDEFDETSDLELTGVRGVYWRQWEGAGTPWIEETINGVTGWWIRFRVTAAAGTTSIPNQQNRHIYTVTWPEIEIQADQAGSGDIPSLARIKVYNHSSQSSIVAPPEMFTNRFFLGARSVSRGEDFRAFINFADEQNQDGITVTRYSQSGWVNRNTTPAGRGVRFTPPDTFNFTLTDITRIDFSQALTAQYHGTFRGFIRLRQEGAGVMTTQAVFGNTWAGDAIYRSPVISINPTAAADEELFTVLDLGKIDIPPPRLLGDGEELEALMIRFFFSCSNVPLAGEVYLADLILIPVDEWACDAEDYTLTGGSTLMRATNGGQGRLAWMDVDSILNPRRRKRAVKKITDTGDPIRAFWAYRANGPVSLQSDSRQRLYLFSMYHLTSGGYHHWVGEPAITSSIQVFRSGRYYAARGSR